MTDNRWATQNNMDAIGDHHKRLRSANNDAEIFAWEVDLIHNILKWGANAAEIIGCAPEQLTSDPSQGAFFALAEERPRMREVYETALIKGEDFYSIEFRGNGDPEPAYWRANCVFIRNEKGDVVKTFGATQNISKERTVASELHLASERLAAAEKASGALIYDWDVVRDKTWRSSGLTRVLGWLPDEIGERMQSWTNLRHPDDSPTNDTIGDFEKVLVDDRYALEYRVRHKNGKYVWVLDAGLVYRDKSGKIIRMAGATVDINARKIAENSQNRQSTLIELSFEPIFVWDFERGILEWNTGAEMLYGYSKEEALGQSASVLLQTKGSHLPSELMQILKHEKTWTGEIEQRAKDGTRISVESRLQAFNDDGQMLVLETNHDVTQRQRADADIARMAAVALASHDALFGVTLDGYIQTWNPGAENIFGYSSNEIIGRSVDILADPSRHNEQQEFMRLAQLDKPIGPYDARRIRKDGTPVDISVSLAPVKALDGKLLSISVAVHDITDRKEWEARQRLMTRELAHRIKNSFAVLQGILRSTLRTAKTPQDFADAFSGRLQSMAAAQDVLTDNDWRGAELGSLIRSQIAAYVEMEAGRIEIAGPTLNLPADYATPFALVFNELATNALKYGALSVPTGSVIVFWRIERELEVGIRIFLTWQERGGPEPKERIGRRGFGSSLIERSLAGAKVESKFEKDGLLFTLELLIPQSKYYNDL